MNIPRSFRRTINFNYRFLKKYFENKPFKLLDVGAGNHSATKITTLFPACEYYGLDLNRNYNYDAEDFKRMKDFYELDLIQLDYSAIPDNYFDAIWIVHVIEHLPNGDKVIQKLMDKLKPGGFIYVEYPGKQSTRLPSMYGTLNFYDDPTHVRIYSVKELSSVFRQMNCTVISAGTRRNWYYILATPLRTVISLLILICQECRGKKCQLKFIAIPYPDHLGFIIICTG
jgi:SAM-dependent methyltransferase